MFVWLLFVLVLRWFFIRVLVYSGFYLIVYGLFYVGFLGVVFLVNVVVGGDMFMLDGVMMFFDNFVGVLGVWSYYFVFDLFVGVWIGCDVFC